MKLLVTGGCGFIGSNFVRFVLEAAVDVEITVLDLLTYAGNLENLGDLLEDPRLTFVPGDIADPAIVDQAARGSWAVVNFAAESHVDRSLHDAAPFIRTNIVGTHVLLDAVRSLGISRFVQISRPTKCTGRLNGRIGFLKMLAWRRVIRIARRKPAQIFLSWRTPARGEFRPSSRARRMPTGQISTRKS